MTQQIIEYACMKKIRDPKTIEKIRKQAKDPNRLHGKEALKALYDQMGMELNFDEIPPL